MLMMMNRLLAFYMPAFNIQARNFPSMATGHEKCITFFTCSPVISSTVVAECNCTSFKIYQWLDINGLKSLCPYYLQPAATDLVLVGYLIKVTFVLIKSFIEKLVAISSHYCHSKRTTIPSTEISQHTYTMQTNVKDLQENKFTPLLSLKLFLVSLKKKKFHLRFHLVKNRVLIMGKT